MTNLSSVKSTSNWATVNVVDANYPAGESSFAFAFIPKNINNLAKLFFILLDRKKELIKSGDAE